MAAVGNVCGVCGGRHVLHVDARWPDGWRAARKIGARVQDCWTEPASAEREEFFVTGVCDACRKRLKAPQEGRRT